jgi:predicted DNA-binding WGR domain protein
MLNFPNESRVFDASRRAVRFWGHDSAMEWSFFVTEDALERLQPNVGHSGASLLRAFDNNRDAIYTAARRAYKRERKGSYELGAFDF